MVYPLNHSYTMAISHVIPLAEHPKRTSSGAIRTLALSCDRHKGAERSQARHLAVDPGVWRDAPRDGWRANGMASMLVHHFSPNTKHEHHHGRSTQIHGEF